MNGNMFMGLFGSDVGVRLSPADATALLAVEGAGPFGPAERPMGGYVSLPVVMHGGPDAIWVDRALEHVRAMPPKASKRLTVAVRTFGPRQPSVVSRAPPPGRRAGQSGAP